MAVMDCDDEIYSTIGENKFGKLYVDFELTDNNQHFSYEK